MVFPDVEEHRHEWDGRDVESVSQGLGNWRASTAADMVSRTCLDDDTVNDQYIVRYLNLQLSWYFAPFYGVTFMMWGPGLICSIMVIWALTITGSLREKFDLLTAVFGKYSSSQDDDYGYDS